MTNDNISISIIGPTAVGKTEIALQLTELPFLKQKFSGFDLISADSKQVYQGMEIITGADIPEQMKADVSLFGVSMIKPNEEWSLSHFRKFGQEILNQSWSNNHLPIIVGGTGLYHRFLFSADEVIDLKPLTEVREKAEFLTVLEMQNWLKSVNEQHFNNMNYSDQNNPRRLVRAIEVALTPAKSTKQSSILKNYRNFTLGIIDSLTTIEQKIIQRVKQRLKTGAIQEVANLLTLDPLPTKQALSAAGVKEIEQLINGQATEFEVIEHWSRRELQYAKRQITWWKKYSQAQWFNREKNNWDKEIFDFVVENIS
jgi:tRNA dimethylallyltransferase